MAELAHNVCVKDTHDVHDNNNKNNNNSASCSIAAESELAEDTFAASCMEHESATTAAAEPVGRATTAWTDTQLLEYLVHRAERAERAGDARRGAHHLALVHDILMRKSATVQQLVTEALHHVLREEEQTSVTPMHRRAETSATEHSSSGAVSRTLMHKQAGPKPAQVDDWNYATVPSKEDTPAPIFDPFAQMLMLPPGLDEADYVEEHAFLSASPTHAVEADDASPALDPAPPLLHDPHNRRTASASVAPTNSRQVRLSRVVDGLVEALRKTPQAALPLREMTVKQEEDADEGDDVVWARLRLTSRLRHIGNKSNSYNNKNNNNEDDESHRNSGVLDLTSLTTMRVLLVYHIASLLWRSDEVAAARAWLSQLDELPPLQLSRRRSDTLLLCDMHTSAPPPHASANVGEIEHINAHDSMRSISTSRTHLHEKPSHTSPPHPHSRSTRSLLSFSSSPLSASSSASSPHSSSFASLCIGPCEPVSENTALARYHALGDRALALRAIVTRLQDCNTALDVVRLIREAADALGCAGADGSREHRQWRKCLYSILRRALRVYYYYYHHHHCAAEGDNNNDDNADNIHASSGSGVAERCDALLRALYEELSEWSSSKPEEETWDVRTPHAHWFLQHLIYKVHQQKDEDYNNNHGQQHQHVLATRQNATPHAQTHEQKEEECVNDTSRNGSMITLLPEATPAAAHSANYALRSRRASLAHSMQPSSTTAFNVSSWATLAQLLCGREQRHIMRVSTQRVRAVAQALHTAIHLLQGELRGQLGEAWWCHWHSHQVREWELFYADTAPVHLSLLTNNSTNHNYYYERSRGVTSEVNVDNVNSMDDNNNASTDTKAMSTSSTQRATRSSAPPWRVAMEAEDGLHEHEAGVTGAGGRTRPELLSSSSWWDRPLPPTLCAAELRERRRQSQFTRLRHSAEPHTDTCAANDTPDIHDHKSRSSSHSTTTAATASAAAASNSRSSDTHASSSRNSSKQHTARHADPTKSGTPSHSGATSWAARASQMMLSVTGAMHAHWYPSPTRAHNSRTHKKKSGSLVTHTNSTCTHTNSRIHASRVLAAAHSAHPRTHSHADGNEVVTLALNVPPPFTPQLRMDVSGFTTTSAHTMNATLDLVSEMTQRQLRIDAAMEEGEADRRGTTDDSEGESSDMRHMRGTALSVMTAPTRRRLHDELPILQQYRSWRVVYHTQVHGTSMHALLRACEAAAAAKRNRRDGYANYDSSQSTRSRCPMLLVLEVAPSTTFDFAGDGAGVRAARQSIGTVQTNKNNKSDDDDNNNNDNNSYIEQTQVHRLALGAFLSDALDADSSRYYGNAETFVFHTLLDQPHRRPDRTPCADENEKRNSTTCGRASASASASASSHMDYRARASATMCAPLRVYHSSGANTQYIHCRRHHGIVIGGSGGEGGSALWIDASLQRGATAGCASFHSPPLTRWPEHQESGVANDAQSESSGSVSFDIVHLEVLVMDD